MVVMQAYSTFNRRVGYASGMGWVAGMLRMYLTEEESFWALVRLFEDYNLESVYTFNKRLGPNRYIFMLERLVEVFLPELARHFVRYSRPHSARTLMMMNWNQEIVDVCVVHFASRWMLSFFAAGLPTTVALRFMDVFLIDVHSAHRLSLVDGLPLLLNLMVPSRATTRCW